MGLGTSSIPKKGDTDLKGKAIADTPNRAISQAARRTTCPGQKQAAKKACKPATLASTGTEVSYHSLGAPSYQCHSCNATMCYRTAIGYFEWPSIGCHSHTSINVELRLLSERTNLRQYNSPTISEVVALITNDFGDNEPTRDIVVNKKDRIMRVNEYNANRELDTRKQDFNQWVLAVGDGRVPAKMKDGEDEPTWIDIPEKFLINSSNSPIEQIVIETYPDFIERQKDDAYLRNEQS
ncbi:ATP-dependent DNA helicase PIF1-like protein [Tanacetum coccineum]